MLKKLDKKILFTLLIFILLILISAYLVEYVLGHKACRLCIYERIPYFISTLLILKLLFVKKNEKIILIIISFVFLCSAILAFYHFGIEQGFFEESIACTTGDAINSLTKQELLDELTYNKMMEGDAQKVDQVNNIQKKIPNSIFVF